MHLVMSTGMTVEQVRAEFDLPRLEAFKKYTQQFPPQHVLVASYFGFGKPEEKATEADNEDFINALMAAFPPPQ